MELQAHKPVFLLGIASPSQGLSDIAEARTEHAKYSPHSCHLIFPLFPSIDTTVVGLSQVTWGNQKSYWRCMVAGEVMRIIYHPFPIYPLALEDSILIISYILPPLLKEHLAVFVIEWGMLIQLLRMKVQQVCCSHAPGQHDIPPIPTAYLWVWCFFLWIDKASWCGCRTGKRVRLCHLHMQWSQ